MTDFKPNLLVSESVMFLIVQFIALFTGIVMIGKPTTPPSMPVMQGLTWFFFAFIIALAIILLVIKFLKRVSFNAFFAFIIFVGAYYVFSAFLPVLLGIVLAAAVVGIRFWKPNLITHNIAIFLGVAGVAAVLGNLLPVLAVIVILFALSIYDFIAVFKTKHMVSMFKDMLKKGMPLAIVVPERPVALTQDVTKVSKQKLRETDKKVLMLGTGDLAFPALFAVSAFKASGSLTVALAIMAGSIIGIVFNHYLLTIKKYKVIPALPFIALFSTIGYFVAILLL
jgi:presenilin-like A22 family membrane protease